MKFKSFFIKDLVSSYNAIILNIVYIHISETKVAF